MEQYKGKYFNEERYKKTIEEHKKEIEELNNTVIESYFLNPSIFEDSSEVGVYLGGLSNLEWAGNNLLWNCEKLKDGEPRYFLTLSEIYHQLEFLNPTLITVFVNNPMYCTVYQCNNYERGEWVKLGVIRGYA